MTFLKATLVRRPAEGGDEYAGNLLERHIGLMFEDVMLSNKHLTVLLAWRLLSVSNGGHSSE